MPLMLQPSGSTGLQLTQVLIYNVVLRLYIFLRLSFACILFPLGPGLLLEKITRGGKTQHRESLRGRLNSVQQRTI